MLWLTNVRLILPDQILETGALALDGDRIAAIVEGDPSPGELRGAATLRLPGVTILPGLVDIHGDMIEKEVRPRSRSSFPADLGLMQLDSKLAACGVTTAFASFTWFEGREIIGEAVCAVLDDLRPHLLVDHFVHARFEYVEPQASPSLIKLLKAGQVHLLSLMDHTPGQGASSDLAAYIERRSAEWRTLLGPEVGRQELLAHVAELQARPQNWDLVETLVGLARERKIPLASHDDNDLAKLDKLQALGVTICEFPVTLAAAEAAKARGLWVAMGAPNALRGGSHIGNLDALDGIAAGVVDILASDYFPSAMLHAAFAIADKGLLPLPAAVKLVTWHPAQAVGLTDRGALVVGKRADLVLVRERPRLRVCGAFCRGTPVYWDGELTRRTFTPWTANSHADFLH